MTEILPYEKVIISRNCSLCAITGPQPMTTNEVMVTFKPKYSSLNNPLLFITTENQSPMEFLLFSLNQHESLKSLNAHPAFSSLCLKFWPWLNHILLQLLHWPKWKFCSSLIPSSPYCHWAPGSLSILYTITLTRTSWQDGKGNKSFPLGVALLGATDRLSWVPKDNPVLDDSSSDHLISVLLTEWVSTGAFDLGAALLQLSCLRLNPMYYATLSLCLD